jgi:transposase InsO family protein
MTRYRAEGEAAFEAKSRRPHTNPNATPNDVTATIIDLRTDLTSKGLDGGPETIRWHLKHHYHMSVSRATVARVLNRHDLVVPEPRKRPKSSYTRFEASQPNECWQSDFTHYQLTKPNGTPGPGTEIITWLDDHSRQALHLTCYWRITAPIVTRTFRQTITDYGTPASTLTDNGMVYTTRYATGRGGRNSFEKELQTLGVTQKNGSPGHPQTQGKVERFQQTLKKWLSAQIPQPTTLDQLQSLLDRFKDEYNNRRPHRSLPHHQTPATRYTTGIKATPADNPDSQPHHRVRYDRVDKVGTVTLRHAGKLHHIGIGRPYTGTYVTMLIQDLNITIIDTSTGEILRDLILNPTRDYQPIT